MNPTVPTLSFLLASVSTLPAATIFGPSTDWTAIPGNYDFLSDQQTGAPAGDIVGAVTNPGLFTTFDDNGPASQTDGFWGFRIRFDAAGGNTNNPAFDRVAWIGIDAGLSDALDVFIAITNQGNTSKIGIHAPGSSANTSPSTTSINSTAWKSYDTTSSNFNYRPVDSQSDGGDNDDLTPSSTGDPDYYLSFLIPFADLVDYMAGISIDIDDESPLRFAVATSTQINTLNQDLGGVDGGINSNLTWSELGGFTPWISATGQVVPEPSTTLISLGMLGGLLLRRRRGA
ncbi:MAG TPA: PEP-CTERM sorting domain-containing protein [Luteolibacter sp.]|nr:PEP-CTERM sorting domain-containing protein [Luteolibacter sp.]